MRFSRTMAMLLILLPQLSLAVSDAELQQIADIVNKQAPAMIDSDTELLGASGSNNTLTYRYKMVNYKATDLDKAKFSQLQREALLKNCAKIAVLLKTGISIVYSYQGKFGEPIASITTTASDCK